MSSTIFVGYYSNCHIFCYPIEYIEIYDSLACPHYMGLLLQFEDEIATNAITIILTKYTPAKLAAGDYRDGSNYLFHWPP